MRYLLIFLMVVPTIAFGENCAPNWLTESVTGALAHLYGSTSYSCLVNLKFTLDNGGYTYWDGTDFWVHWLPDCPVSPNNSVVQLSQTGWVNVPVNLITDNWPHGEDCVGLTLYGISPNGRLSPIGYNVDINVAIVSDIGEAGDDTISSIVGHELGHCIGLGHFTGNDLMNAEFKGIHYFNQLHRNQIDCVYSNTNNCDDGQSPAFFSSILACEAGNSVIININTVSEQSAHHLRILRGEGIDTPFEQYDYLHTIMLNSPEGGDYSYTDTSPGSIYAIEVIDNDNTVSGIVFVQVGGSGIFDYQYPPALVQEMRNYNYQHIYAQFWRDTADGTVIPQSVDMFTPESAEYLIICYDGFIEEIAPICDYWEFRGYEVTLLSCNINNTSEQVRSAIAQYMQYNPLQAVWLIGSSSDEPGNVLFGIELVPTNTMYHDYFYGDYDEDLLIDVPIGRLPARAESEVVYYINKELKYHWETSWGGKKPASKYSTIQVDVLPDNHASGSKEKWTSAQYRVAETGTDVYNILENLFGTERVDGFLSTQLTEWHFGDDHDYHMAVKNHVNQCLSEGRHVIFANSLHNSSYLQYGIIPGLDWQSMDSRGCETFWFVPECYSTPLSSNIRVTIDEPIYLTKKHIPIYELFASSGLAIFGTTDISYHNVTYKVTTKWAEKLLINDDELNHNRSLGQLWMEIYNEIRSEEILAPPGLQEYAIFGDPMLYVRDVYDDENVDANNDIALPLMSATLWPNPANGRVTIDVKNINNAYITVIIYDLLGREVWKQRVMCTNSNEAMVIWSGRDNDGRNTSSGKYYARIISGDNIVTMKFVYIK